MVNYERREDMDMRTRAEHIQWCKERAHKEYDFYLSKERADKARTNAVMSMLSDLGKHDETKGMIDTAFLVSMTVVDEQSLFRFIDGFTE
jgi:hypothetical protein